MQVTQVALRPTESSNAAGRPALTPELLAASGARYSRNNEGLGSILAKIDPENLDKSVDSIFKMIDYGHQSIADMAPVAIFIDGVSMWLAYHVWSLCPTAGGQESSTRYIRLAPDNLPTEEELGLREELVPEWAAAMSAAFVAYEAAVAYWEARGEAHPELTRIPAALLSDPSDKAARQVARMRRNYAFDRARYFLPAALRTNLMLVMSARGWVGLCQNLLSHPLPEATKLGRLIAGELALATPRLLKHATAKASLVAGTRDLLQSWRNHAMESAPYLAPGAGAAPAEARIEVFPPHGLGTESAGQAFVRDLEHHDNRYAYLGPDLARTAVRFGWPAVALGDIRDLNRHRTGSKWCPLVPQGFYAAEDQSDDLASLVPHLETGRAASARARALLSKDDPTFVYWTLLGTQFPFEHTTTADKFLYEAELRTGTGAHFRYARHLHDALEEWYELYPETRGLVLEGAAEPE